MIRTFYKGFLPFFFLKHTVLAFCTKSSLYFLTGILESPTITIIYIILKINRLNLVKLPLAIAG